MRKRKTKFIEPRTSHESFAAVSTKSLYSDSMEERATICCFFDDQARNEIMTMVFKNWYGQKTSFDPGYWFNPILYRFWGILLD